MNQNDKKEFGLIMTGMAEMFGKELSKPALKMWFSLLMDYNIKDIQAAAVAALNSCRYMPKPAEFKEFLPGIETQAMIENKAHAEADRILGHLRTQGAAHWPEMPDPITRYLMTTRWPYPVWASNLVESETVWWRKEFIEAYRSYQDAGAGHELIEAPESVRRLVGKIGDITPKIEEENDNGQD